MSKERNISGTGGQILVDCLLTQGVNRVFCVPGESYLAALDALYHVRERIKLIVCRHESGAANMADAYGKLTGRPGVAMVTRGPGAAHAAVGLHTAYQDSTPLVLFVGQVARNATDREAFQEIDHRRFFSEISKWSAQIDTADRIPEYVSRAFHTAASGRPGPVVLALPEDMLAEHGTAPAASRYQRIAASPSAAQLDRLQALLGASSTPVVILGGSGWTAAACEDLRHFAETWNLPVTCSFRSQDLFDNDHPQYAGDVGIAINPKLAQRIRQADLILAIGARLGEIATSGYTLLAIPEPRQTLIHVHAGAEELGRVYSPNLPINSGTPEIAAALKTAWPPSTPAWDAHTRAAREDYLEWSTPAPIVGPLQLGDIITWLRERLPDDAIITNGAGNYTVWLHRYYRHRRFRSQLAPKSGAMGYGVPAAIAAQSLHPERAVICFAGDGCFMMTAGELATAVQYELPVIFIVVNNASYGTIRMHQERRFPGRVHGSELLNPDFAAFARSFGAFGGTVERTEEFAPVFERAITSGKPALIELRLPIEAITPSATLSEIRSRALEADAGAAD